MLLINAISLYSRMYETDGRFLMTNGKSIIILNHTPTSFQTMPFWIPCVNFKIFRSWFESQTLTRFFTYFWFFIFCRWISPYCSDKFYPHEPRIWKFHRILLLRPWGVWSSTIFHRSIWYKHLQIHFGYIFLLEKGKKIKPWRLFDVWHKQWVHIYMLCTSCYYWEYISKLVCL